MKNLMRKAREAKKDERGLTLVELLAVVVILAIVSAIAFVLIGNVIENSKKDAHIANAQQFISAVKLAEASGDAFKVVEDGTATATTQDALELDTVVKALDPWDKKPYETAVVTKKSDGFYFITLEAEEEVEECEIVGKSEKTLQGNREVAC